ncbi:MAG: hypothetical protein GX801_01120 [Fibrobacter sp.]|nr:hypothetical protein [Fibrobacter sp.]
MRFLGLICVFVASAWANAPVVDGSTVVELPTSVDSSTVVELPASVDSSTVVECSEQSEECIETEVHYGKLTLVASATSLSFLGSWFLVFRKAWWDESTTKFHFKNDFEYAKNLDKLGHFYAGALIGEGFYDGLRWSGVSEFKSHLWAGIFASLTHVGVDIKDGFSSWGYSVWDVVGGSLGGFWPMAQKYVPFMKYVDYKMSYWVNSKLYWTEGDHTGVFTDDYPNQTHWLSFRINAMLPDVLEPFWPDWLNIAVGLSVEDGIFARDDLNYAQNNQRLKDARRQVYIGLDYDLQVFKPKAYWAKRLLTYANYIKLPAPSVRVYPDFEVQWVYPIQF